MFVFCKNSLNPTINEYLLYLNCFELNKILILNCYKYIKLNSSLNLKMNYSLVERAQWNLKFLWLLVIYSKFKSHILKDNKFKKSII